MLQWGCIQSSFECGQHPTEFVRKGQTWLDALLRKMPDPNGQMQKGLGLGQ